ncbi:hypothetical protein DFH06DRAFT_1338411 [Mycena polygramma]|nr:hypothetical protein DFH06DRAFT_1338411 [Mycena polygramma]
MSPSGFPGTIKPSRRVVPTPASWTRTTTNAVSFRQPSFPEAFLARFTLPFIREPTESRLTLRSTPPIHDCRSKVTVGVFTKSNAYLCAAGLVSTQGLVGLDSRLTYHAVAINRLTKSSMYPFSFVELTPFGVQSKSQGLSDIVEASGLPFTPDSSEASYPGPIRPTERRTPALNAETILNLD